jgi:hypothetical protein
MNLRSEPKNLQTLENLSIGAGQVEVIKARNYVLSRAAQCNFNYTTIKRCL